MTPDKITAASEDFNQNLYSKNGFLTGTSDIIRTILEKLSNGYVMVLRNCREADINTGAFDGYVGDLQHAYKNVQNYIDWSIAGER